MRNESSVPLVLIGPGKNYRRAWPDFRDTKNRNLSNDMLFIVAQEIARGELPEAAIDIYSQDTAVKLHKLVRAIRKLDRAAEIFCEASSNSSWTDCLRRLTRVFSSSMTRAVDKVFKITQREAAAGIYQIVDFSTQRDKGPL